VNLKQGQLQVFRDLAESGYQSELVLAAGEVSPLAFEDVKVVVSRLWGQFQL